MKGAGKNILVHVRLERHLTVIEETARPPTLSPVHMYFARSFFLSSVQMSIQPGSNSTERETNSPLLPLPFIQAARNLLNTGFFARRITNPLTAWPSLIRKLEDNTETKWQVFRVPEGWPYLHKLSIKSKMLLRWRWTLCNHLWKNKEHSNI